MHHLTGCVINTWLISPEIFYLPDWSMRLSMYPGPGEGWGTELVIPHWILALVILHTFFHHMCTFMVFCIQDKILLHSLACPPCVVAQCLHSQETNPAELLRLYLTFDLLEEATYLAMDYIDAVLGPQKQDFAMKVTCCRIGRPCWATAINVHTTRVRGHTHILVHRLPSMHLLPVCGCRILPSITCKLRCRELREKPILLRYCDDDTPLILTGMKAILLQWTDTNTPVTIHQPLPSIPIVVALFGPLISPWCQTFENPQTTTPCLRWQYNIEAEYDTVCMTHPIYTRSMRRLTE